MSLQVCRWVTLADPSKREAFENAYTRDLFTDGSGNLCLLTETRFRADYIADKNPGVTLHNTMELH
jgi:peptide subunit release factor RF-3